MNDRLSALSFPRPGRRIVVVGTTSSGKTTVAARLSRILGIPHVELDGLMWRPNWEKTPTDTFLARVRAALDGPAWVVDGNYSAARTVTWGQADTLVWLDYPLALVFWRLTVRTLRRILTREKLWGCNRETVRRAFFDKDSLYRYVIPSRRRQRETYPRALREDYAHLQVVHLKTARQTVEWLDEVGKLEPRTHKD